MNTSRTTVTAIYNAARRKVADALVNGKRLLIDGGNVALCRFAGGCCGRCGAGNRCGGCRLACRQKVPGAPQYTEKTSG